MTTTAPKGLHPRSCGDCRLCCTVMGVPDLEPVAKPGGVACGHLCSRGCRVYPQRPQSCRDFNCLWKQGALLKADRPDKVGVVFATTDTGRLVGHVDATRPELWRELIPYLERVAAKGLASVIQTNGRAHHLIDERGVQTLTPKDPTS